MDDLLPKGLPLEVGDGEKDSLEYCKDSDFKYYIFYVSDLEYNYTDYEYIPKDNAVSIRII